METPTASTSSLVCVWGHLSCLSEFPFSVFPRPTLGGHRPMTHLPMWTCRSPADLQAARSLVSGITAPWGLAEGKGPGVTFRDAPTPLRRAAPAGEEAFMAGASYPR